MPLQCTGANGVAEWFEFEYEQDQFAPEWTFRVFAVPPPPNGDFFDCTVEEVNMQTVEIIAIRNPGGNFYRAKGIPDALIPLIAQTLGRTVRSSPASGPPGVWRTAGATRMWERLKNKGLAGYDPNLDIYTHP
jgi:hypothetical protein